MKHHRLIAPLLLTLLSPCALAGTTEVKGIRSWAAPDHTRLVLDLSAPVHYKLFTLQNPDRVVLDLYDVQFNARIPAPRAQDRFLLRIRSGVYKQRRRVVLDLKTVVRPSSFLLTPYKNYGHRLVVDLYSPAPKPEVTPTAKAPPIERTVRLETPSPPLGKTSPGPPAESTTTPPPRDVLIAIDPGHGGEDPGALGASRRREKNLVMQISRKLHRLIQKELGMSSFLVRDGDYYVALDERVKKATRRNADLFISIHADAFEDPGVRGSTVYVLSRKGASSKKARILAARENASDFIGGISIAGKDPVLSSVLVDLQRDAVMGRALSAAKDILQELNRIGKIRKRPLESANFSVLRAPDVSSILIETGYITNPQEEKRLSDPAYQEKLAMAILRGLRRHFSRHAPQDSRLAAARSQGT